MYGGRRAAAWRTMSRYPAANLAAEGGGNSCDNGDATARKKMANVSADVHSGQGGRLYPPRAGLRLSRPATNRRRWNFVSDGKPSSVRRACSRQPECIPGQRVFSPALLLPARRFFEVQDRTCRRAQIVLRRRCQRILPTPANANPNLRSRVLRSVRLEVATLPAPLQLPPMPEPMQAFLPTPPAAGNQRGTPRGPSSGSSRILARLAAAGLCPDELDRLMKLYDLADQQGEKFEARVKLAMKAVLVSPHFLFRGEIQPDPTSPDAVHPIDEFELASRLSYFLWSSMPDDELLRPGQARQAAAQNLDAQVRGCWRPEGPRRWSKTSPANGCRSASWPIGPAGQGPVSRLRRPRCAAHEQRNRAVLRGHHARRPQRPRFLDCRLHLRQRPPGEALRHRGVEGDRFPAGARWRARTRGGVLTQASVLDR